MSDIKVTKVETDLETKTITVNLSDHPSSVNVEGWQAKTTKAPLQWVSLTRNIRRSNRKTKSHFRK